MSWFADFKEDVIPDLEDIANANVVLAHVSRGNVLAICPSIVQLSVWGVLCLPVRVVLWIVLMHRALSPAMFTECMFVSVEASPTAKDQTMVLFFVNCRGDLSSEKMLFDFSSPNLQQNPLSGMGASSSWATFSLMMFLGDRRPIAVRKVGGFRVA
jgi:hypothetical protein